MGTNSAGAWDTDERLKVEESIAVAASPDVVWRVIAPFDAIAQWHPAVESSPADRGNETGSIRRIELVDGGGQLVETLVSHTDAQRTYTYTMADGGPVPVSEYRSTMAVRLVGQGAEVVWSGEFRRRDTRPNPPAGADDAAALDAVRVIYRAGLDSIAKKVGSTD